MNKLINEFIEYLFSIGLLSRDFASKFQSVENNNTLPNETLINRFKKNMCNSLIDFIFSLNKEEKEKFALNIVNKFLQNILFYKLKQLKFSVLLSSKISQKNLAKLAFTKWKLNSNFLKEKEDILHRYSLNKNLLYTNSNLKTEDTILRQKSNPNNNNISTKNNYMNNNPPSIFYGSNIYNNNIFNNYRKSKDQFNQKVNILYKQTKNRNKICPNNSTIEVNNKSTSKDKSNSSINNNNKLKSNSLSLCQSMSFYDKQIDYMEKKKEREKNFLDKLNDELGKCCTFKPKIEKFDFKFRTAPGSPIHTRLYDDFKIRNVRQLKEQSEKDLQIKKDCSKGNYLLNKEKIEQLYNDYKTKKLKRKNLSELSDIENGITYKPWIPHDEYYNKIKTTFNQREKNFVNDKKKFNEKCLQEFIKFQTNQIVGFDRLKNANLNEINKNTLERLYVQDTQNSKSIKTNKTWNNFNNTIPSTNSKTISSKKLSYNYSNILQINKNTNSNNNSNNATLKGTSKKDNSLNKDLPNKNLLKGD